MDTKTLVPFAGIVIAAWGALAMQINWMGDGLNKRMDGLSGRMDRVEAHMGGLDARLRSVETGIVSLDTRLQNVERGFIAAASGTVSEWLHAAADESDLPGINDG